MNDWPARLQFAVVQLHIPPAAFWRLSVKEWAALTAKPPPDSLSRKALDGLMRDHPDEGVS